jgi:hypothetical protein
VNHNYCKPLRIFKVPAEKKKFRLAKKFKICEIIKTVKNCNYYSFKLHLDQIKDNSFTTFAFAMDSISKQDHICERKDITPNVFQFVEPRGED